MDPPKKQQSTAVVSPKEPTSTLLDAYEVECITRELESLLLNHSAAEGAAEILGLRRSRRRRGQSSKNRPTSAKNAHGSGPAPPTKKLSGGGTRLHLVKHAVKICGGAVAVSSAGANCRRPRRAGYREVDKV